MLFKQSYGPLKFAFPSEFALTLTSITSSDISRTFQIFLFKFTKKYTVLNRIVTHLTYTGKDLRSFSFMKGLFTRESASQDAVPPTPQERRLPRPALLQSSLLAWVMCPPWCQKGYMQCKLTVSRKAQM